MTVTVERPRPADARRRLLTELARDINYPRLTSQQLRADARSKGLDPTIEECRAALAELYPSPMAYTSKESLVLRAARTLPAPFSLAALTVACWRLYPQAFGLEGFEEEYPDNQKVRCCLYGQRKGGGLLARGLLVKDGAGFRATERATP